MAGKEQVRALLERYCSAMNEHRREDWLDCFADDAVQEDPVGSTPNEGRDAIGRYFDGNDVEVTLSVAADPLVIGLEVIAFFQAVAEMEAGRMLLPRIVDHIVLTEDGSRFQALRAFFDYAELVPAEIVPAGR
jgi:steroid delta-isomerase